MKVKKALYVVLGCIGVVLGAVGAVMPILPAFPFLMLAAFCFARSSDRLDQWFKGTRLYKNNLEDYIAGRGMTWKTKIRIMLMVTFLMSIGFFMMGRKGIFIVPSTFESGQKLIPEIKTKCSDFRCCSVLSFCKLGNVRSVRDINGSEESQQSPCNR